MILFTYLAISLYMLAVGILDPWINAVVRLSVSCCPPDAAPVQESLDKAISEKEFRLTFSE